MIKRLAAGHSSGESFCSGQLFPTGIQGSSSIIMIIMIIIIGHRARCKWCDDDDDDDDDHSISQRGAGAFSSVVTLVVWREIHLGERPECCQLARVCPVCTSPFCRLVGLAPLRGPVGAARLSAMRRQLAMLINLLFRCC